MHKTVLHLFHADPAALQTVPALAERIGSNPETTLEVYVFGPAERMLAEVEQVEFNIQIDALVTTGVQVTTCIGIAQQIGAEVSFRARKLTLESAAEAFPRFAAEGATVISF